MTPKRLITPLLALALAGCGPSDPTAEVTTALAAQVYLPSYTAWQQADRELAERAGELCTDNGQLEAARQAFYGAFAAWSALQPLMIGPLAEGNRAWQVQFWPDKKNLVQRQVEALLKRDSQVSAEQLAKSSVVVRGLTAAEYILFDPAIDLTQAEQKARYCPLLSAIGVHQKALAGEILAQWQAPETGMSAQLKVFPNERYAESSEALADILRAQVSAIDGVKKRLNLPLGRQSKGISQPFQAEAWRSEASLTNLDATLASAEALWLGVDGHGIKQLLSDADHDLGARIDSAYQDSRARLAALRGNLTELLKSPAGVEQLNELYDSLNRLHRLQESELAQVLGVQIGFNAHDGD